MSIKSIPCGGFMYDDETIAFEKDEYGRDVIKIEAGDTLPEVTAADNGKLLGVVNGEWGKVAGGGGTQTPFIVNFTSIDDDDQHVSCNKTGQEVKTAIANHENIMAYLTYILGGNYFILNCMLIMNKTDDPERLAFSFYNDGPDGIYAITVLYDEDTQSWMLG